MSTQSPVSLNPVPASTNPQTLPSSILDSTGTEHLEAFEATRADRDALSREALVQIYADVRKAAERVLGASLRGRAYDAQLARIPEAVGLRERTERYAKAAAHAQDKYLNAMRPPAEILPLFEELKQYRDTFVHEVNVLVKRGVLSAEQLNGIGSVVGYRAAVADVARLCDLLRGSLAQIAGKSFVTLEEINAASALGERLEKLVILRDDMEKERAIANDTRQRAFTLMHVSYDQFQRMISFILWGTDLAAEIAPSLQSGGRKGRSADDEGEVVEPATPNGANAPANGGAANGASNTAGVAPGARSSGSPGDSPFIDE